MKTPNVSGFLYEKIAAQMAQAMDEGIIPLGSKLPSLRKMCGRYNCALSVVMQAYEMLEAQGRTIAVEKSGFFASSPKKSPLPTPQNEVFSMKSEDVKPLSILGRIVEASNDKSIVPLGAGVPHESLLPINPLKQIISSVVKNQSHLLSEYSDEAGNPQLRSEIARLMLQRGVSLSMDDILITNGCTEALSLAIQSCSGPGDVIALESPVFPGIIQLINQLKRRIIPIPTSVNQGMDLKRLEEVLALGEVKAVVMTGIYQNPLGFVMDQSHKKAAVELVKKHDAILIEDDIYHDCSFLQKEERSIKGFDESGDVIYCSSFSKSVSPAMRIGWLVGGKKHRSCRNLKMALTLGSSPIFQQAMAEYLQSSRYEKHILRLQKTMARQAQEITQLLIKDMPRGSAITQPEGGYYLWVELPGEVDTLVLFEQALSRGISMVPGQAFSLGERFNNCIRISFASPIDDQIRRGITELGQIIKSHIGQT
ncbi:MAG: PLP-dependent aminotransferase family protein [Spirochaetaceae bacterium]|jgi:DNA-binding transcriptional MocR family regulator|nr:PLP-dependent aminotransferase family protein [Spirochaetaceae bacterium]